MKWKKKQGKNEPLYCGYDYSTRENREDTVNTLYLRAKTARAAVELRERG